MNMWEELHKQFPAQIQEPRIQHLAGYARRMGLDAGNTALTHVHNSDHYSILEAGSVLVSAGEVVTRYDAPAVVLIKAAVAHSIQALTDDVVWLCVHLFPMGTDIATVLADEVDRVTIQT